MNMSHFSTSSVTKHTKEEGGDFSGSHLSEAKGAYKCPLSTSSCQDTVGGGGEGRHFEHKFDLALGLENPRSFCVCLFVFSPLELISWLFLLESFTGQWLNPFGLPARKQIITFCRLTRKKLGCFPSPDLAPRSHRPFYSSNVGKACNAVTSKEP